MKVGIILHTGFGTLIIGDLFRSAGGPPKKCMLVWKTFQPKIIPNSQKKEVIKKDDDFCGKNYTLDSDSFNHYLTNAYIWESREQKVHTLISPKLFTGSTSMFSENIFKYLYIRYICMYVYN